MHRYLNIVLCVSFAVATLYAVDKAKEEERLENAAVVMEEVMGMPDTIPQDLLDKAECVVVIPSVTKVAIGIGGSYGRGAMACRTGQQFNGPWGAPARST